MPVACTVSLELHEMDLVLLVLDLQQPLAYTGLGQFTPEANFTVLTF